MINSEEYQSLKDNIQTVLDEALEEIRKEESSTKSHQGIPVTQSSPVGVMGY
ncbi:hypothetical protein [Moritella sp.]|uniref:hypothetical protein n=1 Tax=Moritella sp. TaxID=78556 RepID=UPI0025EA5320|nr:hypothetical protein [Moritella sp.]